MKTDITIPVVIYLVFSVALIALKFFGLGLPWWLVMLILVAIPALAILYCIVKFIGGLPG